jgi:Domain of unknown function (DUF4145)
MAGKYVAPEPHRPSFTCPKCETLCTQVKQRLYSKISPAGYAENKKTWFTKCMNCDSTLLWHDGKIVDPPVSAAPHPHHDLPEEFVADYEEARAIVGRSPRGAAALLRYIMDGLTIKLREAKGGSLHDRIGWLIKHKNVSPMAQQSLDAVRVIGANAVHPLTMDLSDDVDLATKLFYADQRHRRGNDHSAEGVRGALRRAAGTPAQGD